MKAVDFYCGAGGLTRGLLDAGIDVIAGIDEDERCRRTYEHNNHPTPFIQADVRSLSVQDVRRLIVGVPRRELLFAGCSPCQSFSAHGRSNGRRPDGSLLTAFGKFVAALRPGQVLVENVPGIRRVGGFSAYRRFIGMLGENGYTYVDAVLDAKVYGVPQTRRRFILIATRGLEPTLPKPTHGKHLAPYNTVADAISHYPPIEAGEHHPYVANHLSSTLSPVNLKRLRSTPRDGGDRRSWPSQLVLNCHAGDHDGHTDVYGRMFWDKPAPTLTGKCQSLSNGRYGHPTQDRAISLREAASIQSFDDDYVFYGGLQTIALHIGNAVPVRLADVLGTHLLSMARR